MVRRDPQGDGRRHPVLVSRCRTTSQEVKLVVALLRRNKADKCRNGRTYAKEAFIEGKIVDEEYQRAWVRLEATPEFTFWAGAHDIIYQVQRADTGKTRMKYFVVFNSTLENEIAGDSAAEFGFREILQSGNLRHEYRFEGPIRRVVTRSNRIAGEAVLEVVLGGQMPVLSFVVVPKDCSLSEGSVISSRGQFNLAPAENFRCSQE